MARRASAAGGGVGRADGFAVDAVIGFDGGAAGKVPLAWWKIALAILVGLGIAAAIYVLARGGQPPP